MIKAIIYDLGGVIIYNPSSIMLDHYRQQFNAGKKQFMKAFRQIEDGIQRGILSEKKAWQKINKILGKEIQLAEGIWFEGFMKAYRERDHIFSHIKSLRQKNYLVGLLSNTEIPIMNFFHKKHKDKFDALIYSCKIKMRKPDRKIYEFALNKLKIKPQEAVFIDDRIENIKGAEMIGIRTILFQSEAQYFTDLTALLKTPT